MIDGRQRRTALLVAGCFFMEMLDATIVVTAIPQMSASLDASTSSMSLVVTAYLLTLAVLIPLSGWMTARFGARRVFLSAIAMFVVASLGCALSSSLEQLVATRVMQGVGGAMMVPVGRLVVLGPAPKSQLMRLVSYLVWPALLAPVVAPLAGGLITTYASWRWMFVINLPLGVVAFAVAWRLIGSIETAAPPRLDRVGVLLTCTGLGGVILTGELLSRDTLDWGLVIAVSLASLVLLGAAVGHLLHTEAPLVNLRTLRIPTFRAVMAGISPFLLVVGAIPFLLPLLFQTVFGWSPIKSGAVVLFIFVGNIAVKPATSWLYSRFGFRNVLLGATGGLAMTTLAVALFDADTPISLIALVALLSGVARSVGLTGYSTLAFSDVPSALMRDANTLAATAQQLCAGLGVAAATVALRAGDLLLAEHSRRAAFAVAFALLALIALTSMLQAVRLHPHAGRVLVATR